MRLVQHACMHGSLLSRTACMSVRDNMGSYTSRNLPNPCEATLDDTGCWFQTQGGRTYLVANNIGVTEVSLLGHSHRAASQLPQLPFGHRCSELRGTPQDRLHATCLHVGSGTSNSTVLHLLDQRSRDPHSNDQERDSLCGSWSSSGLRKCASLVAASHCTHVALDTSSDIAAH